MPGPNPSPTGVADVLVIGAGLAGLMAARSLVERGLQVVVIDKGRSPGGRLATRRVGPGRADTGAQFFTVRSQIFRAHVMNWQAQGWVDEWARGWSGNADGHVRYRAAGGFAALARSLAAPLSLTCEVRVGHLGRVGGDWLAQAEGGGQFVARSVIMTLPVPQAVSLLVASGIDVPDSVRAVAYAPCLAGLYWIEGGKSLPEPGGVQHVSERVSWVSDNQRKGVSPEARLLTVHGSPDFSRLAYDWADEDVLASLWAEVEPLVSAGLVREQQLKRWRYAQPVAVHAQRAVMLSAQPPLALAGDGFGEARLEGAALSGLTAADAIADHFLPGGSDSVSP